MKKWNWENDLMIQNLLENVTEIIAEYEPEAKKDEKIVVCFPPFLLKGVEPPTKFSKKGAWRELDF